ncbi:MAG: hypothetical protein OXC00_07590 [Acidimicrobiaceae bacterium]|nr:hypothetical protein [Acidimicrobiaceae bacterium]
MDAASDNLPEGADAAGRGDQLDGIERDLDTVDAALSALDSDDLEGAEALAADLEESHAASASPTADQEDGNSRV